MFKLQKFLYTEGSVEKYFQEITDLLNKVAEDPLNEEFAGVKVRWPFFPLVWDLNQFYFIMKTLYRNKVFDNMTFIIPNREYNNIHEIFMFDFIETDEEEIKTADLKMNFQVISFDKEKHGDFFNQVCIDIKNFNVNCFKTLQNFLKENYNYRLGHLFIIPEHIANVGILESTDYINSDLIKYLKDFIGLLRKGMIDRKHVKTKYMPVIQFSSKKNRTNPLINTIIKTATDWADVDFNKFFDLTAELLEELRSNIIMFDNNNRPIMICRMLIQNGKIHLNPVPISFVESYLLYNEDKKKASIEEIVKSLYNKTRTDTIAMKFESMEGFTHNSQDPNYSFVEGLIDSIISINSCQGYPRSLLSNLLSGFGVDCSKAIPQMKDGIIYLLKFFKRILVASLINHPEGWKDLDALFEIDIDSNNRIRYKQIPIEEYKKYFDEHKARQGTDALKEAIEKKTGLEYPLIAVVKIDQFSKIFSMKNLQSIAEMSQFMQSLPSIEKISGIMQGFSENGNNQKIVEEEISSSEELSEDIVKDLPSLNHFLSKGIVFSVSKGKELFFREDSKSGYLGLDIIRLRKFIEANFPEILIQ